MATAVLALRLLLAGVFLAAGIGKLRDLPGSRRAVEDFGIPKRAARVVGLLLPLAEIAIAVALVPTPSARWGLSPRRSCWLRSSLESPVRYRVASSPIATASVRSIPRRRGP